MTKLILLASILLLAGCVLAPPRLTTETVWPANPDTGDPAELVIEWPAGVRKADLFSTEVSSRTMTVAPLRGRQE